MIKTFRGLMADGDKQVIRLGTNDGLIGYKIKKFQLIGRTPGSMTIEAVCKIFTIDPSAIDGTVNFNDPTLLAAGYYVDNSSSVYTNYETIVFDDKIFNQDIYITHSDQETGEYINYYIELEQMRLDLGEATVATLKDMRGRE